VRVYGMSSAAPLDKDDPSNPMNRRISLIVLNKETAQAVEKVSGPADVGSVEDIKPTLTKSQE
jgi:chemotaxis protein MotB